MAVEPGANLLHASLGAGLQVANQCGGAGRCSTCRVTIVHGTDRCSPRSPAEETIARQLGLAADIRLACQTLIRGDVTIRRRLFDWEDARPAAEPIAVTPACPPCGEVELAILFADIDGFTAFAEQLPPYDVVYILNRYYHHMGRIILRYGGLIVNYMGDGLLAVFGIDPLAAALPAATPAATSPPPSPPSPAVRCVRAGREMLRTMDRLKPYLAAHHGRDLDLRLGAHWGETVVGNVGCDDQRRLTVIGDAVNLASRIERHNKTLGSRFLISGALRDQLAERIPLRAKEGIVLRGRAGDTTLFEVGDG